MDAQRAPAAFEQNREVPARLGVLHDAKGGAMPRDGQVVPIVRSNLKKHAVVRAAFVSLARRMQKTWPEFKAGRNTAPIAYRQPQLLQARKALCIAGEIRQQGKIVAAADAGELRGEKAFNAAAGPGLAQSGRIRLVGIERDRFFRANRRLSRQRAGPLEPAR